MQNVYFFIGTKAQAIKCISLIKKMSELNNVKITIINSGQHIEITENILNKLGNRLNYIYLNKNNKNVSQYLKGIKWFIYMFVNKILLSKKIDNLSNEDICIIHGDTASTLLGLLWSKKNKLKTIHLESGLTSNNLLNPFPEEIIRNIVSKFSDILISSDDESFERLNNNYKRKTIIKISENTIFEEIKKIQNLNFLNKSKILVTLHRTENILSRKRMESFVNLINFLADSYEVDWYCHEPTMHSLKKFQLKTSESINIKMLIEHSEFLKKIQESNFVITDGGSIQEECFYLNKMTIIWRKKTERPYALNSNMFISNFDIEKCIEFIESNISKDHNAKRIESSPVDELIQQLIELNVLNS